MSSNGHNVDVMNGTDLNFWTFLVGFLLCVSVCDSGCVEMNFEQNISDQLLKDHIFQIKNFTCPGKTYKGEHNLLSVIAMVCSSFKANQKFSPANVKKKCCKGEANQDCCNNEAKKECCNDSRTKVIWAFEKILQKLANQEEENQSKIIEFCDQYTCQLSYGSSYINVSEFKEIYQSVCKLDVKKTVCPQPGDCEVPPRCPPCLTHCPVTQSSVPSTPTTATDLQSGSSVPSTPTTATHLQSSSSLPSTPTTATHLQSGSSLPSTPTTTTDQQSSSQVSSTPTTATDQKSSSEFTPTPTSAKGQQISSHSAAPSSTRQQHTSYSSPTTPSDTHQQNTRTPTVQQTHTDRLNTASIKVFQRSDVAVLILLIILAVSLLLNLGLFFKLRRRHSHQSWKPEDGQCLRNMQHDSQEQLDQSPNTKMPHDRSHDTLL